MSVVMGAHPDALTKSTKEKPLTQAYMKSYFKLFQNQVFDIAKIGIDVELTKAVGGESVVTNVLARDGRKIEETKNTAKAGQAIDTRTCINGDLDQYAKKPEKVTGLYQIEDGRSFADIAPGETVRATTIGGEKRRAIVAPEDIFLATTWGEVQHIAKGGLITMSGDEAIGNNNPCDMVMVNGDKQGTVPLTESVFKIRADLEKQGVQITPAMEGFMQVAAVEDRKNPYRQSANASSKGLEM